MDKKEKFIEKARNVHGDKYDYSKVIYNNCKERVCIICPQHGEFWQTPDNHINAKQGCPKCGREKAIANETLTSEKFIEKARKIHGDNYDYSKVKYVDNKTKVCIICPQHGEFWQTPANHTNIRLKQGCPKCKFEKLSEIQRMTKEEFISKAIKVHGNKYDYSQVIMNGLHNKVKIYCKKCGKYFYQEANSHLYGRGCPNCLNKNLTTSTIVTMFKNVHGNKYDYSKVDYKTMKTKVCIICPKHGEFWQTPEKHLIGQGCLGCKESHLENDVRVILEKNNIKYLYDKTNVAIGNQRFDFYLPDYNLAIECQGIQHFKPSSFSNKIDAEISFKRVRRLDEQKLLNARKNGIKIIYYTDLKYRTFMGEKIIDDKNKLIEAIKSSQYL